MGGMRAIHDDEPDLSAAAARRLLATQCPGWAGLPLRPVEATGTSNAMWRLGEHLVLRLPRTADAADGVLTELAVLGHLRDRLPVAVPEIAYAGAPTDDYPYPWAVLTWSPGRDAWACLSTGELRPGAAEEALAQALAEIVTTLRQLDPAAFPTALARRRPGERGGPIPDLDESVHEWAQLGSAAGVLDLDAVLSAWAPLADTAYRGPFVVTHGDLIPGNLLLSGTRLTGVLDWGGAALADPALDLLPAWTLLSGTGRRAFREQLDCQEPEWLRGKAFALQQAIAGVAYYVPRGEAAGLFHARSLAAVLGPE